MNRTLLFLPVAMATGCIREEIPYWGVVAGGEVPLVLQTREGCQTVDYETMGYSASVDGIAARKPRGFAWRGATAAYGAFDLFEPTRPGGDEIKALAPRLWGYWAGPTTTALRWFTVGEFGPGGPAGAGALGLACTTGGNQLFQFDAAGGPLMLTTPTTYAGYELVGATGDCDGTTHIGPSGTDRGLVVAFGAGVATEVSLAPAPGATVLGEPLPAVDPGEVVFVERLADGRIAAVTLTGGVATWVTADTTETTPIDGDPLPSPVWRGADGALRLATTYGVYTWEPGTDAALVEVVPAVPVEAAWEPAVGAGTLVAVASVPNEAEPTLDVPVAAAVAVAHDGGWAVQEVPTTPCVDRDLCRGYGESRIVSVIGPPTDPILLYDVWRWDAEELHETFACPR